MTSTASQNQSGIKHLALYHYDGCGFCAMVRRQAQQLGVELELRNIRSDRSHYTALMVEMGRGTVPVLHITYNDGEVQWMPESSDIISFLTANFKL